VFAILAVPSFASANVVSQGGQVESSPHLYAVYWGNNWNTNSTAASERSRLNGMMEALSGSSWQGILSQYWGPGGFISKTVTHGTPYTDTRVSAPASINSSKIATEASEAIKANEANGWPKSPTSNDQIIVFTPPGTTYATPADHENCGYHFPNGSYSVSYVGWDANFGECAHTVTFGHEYAESASDPFRDGWRFFGGEEIADLCEFAERGFLSGGYEVPSLWDNNLEKCALADANPPQLAPEIITDEATEVLAKKATLNGHAVPHGLQIKKFYFEWGLFKANEHQTAEQEFFPHHEPWNAAATITGLSPNTTYHYRVVVVDSEFPFNKQKGQEAELKTAGKPTVTTEPATHTNSYEPQLNAMVNAGGIPTTYQFEYGQTGFESKIPATPASAGSSKEAVAVSQTLSGLAKNTTYRFRVVAENEAGTTVGGEVFFKSLGDCPAGENACAWSVQTVPNPVPKAETRLKDVSCASSAMCMAIGRDSYTGKAYLEQWTGTEWTLRNSFGGTDFAAISCPSTTVCYTAGTASNGTLTSWRFEWNGLFWESSSKALAVPSGGTLLSLRDISCSSASACTAAGSYTSEANGSVPLAERWNGTEWAVQSVPAPSGEEGKSGGFFGVSCASASECIAIGKKSVITGEGPFYHNAVFAERWNSTTGWALQAVPNPGGYEEASLASVSCPTTTSCTAVGQYTESSKPAKTLTERWNGSSWAVQASPNPVEGKAAVLAGVSCVSASSCLAVGNYLPGGLEEKTLAESWNGTEWSVKTTPNPTGSAASSLAGVSCSSAIACTAAGSFSPTLGTSESLAERYE
jgi:hypothetical protein